jgi:hypothetical protein
MVGVSCSQRAHRLSIVVNHHAASHAIAAVQVKPYLAYALLFLNLAVYGAGVGLALTQGNDFSNEWFLSLAKVNDKVASGEFYRSNRHETLTSCQNAPLSAISLCVARL